MYADGILLLKQTRKKAKGLPKKRTNGVVLEFDEEKAPKTGVGA